MVAVAMRILMQKKAKLLGDLQLAAAEIQLVVGFAEIHLPLFGSIRRKNGTTVWTFAYPSP